MGGFVFLMLIDLVFGLHGDSNESSGSTTNDATSNPLSFGFIFHSACDGIALGAGAYTGDTQLIVAIFIGIFCHKLVVALALVSNLLKKASKKKCLISLVLFSIACPLAAFIVLGILILTDASQESLVPGIMIAISAGTLMY